MDLKEKMRPGAGGEFGEVYFERVRSLMFEANGLDFV
jgi:hypothetical protein